MKNLYLLLITLIGSAVMAQDEFIEVKIPTGTFSFMPIQHASMVMKINDKILCVDPTGNRDNYPDFEKTDYILITDIHQDHYSPETIRQLSAAGTKLLVPKAVYEMMPQDMKKQSEILYNDGHTKITGFDIQAIPMYNFPETEESFHKKGRGNGYLLDLGGFRIYISGDTQNTPEMQKLENIDLAFVCMNTPYTMSVEEAAQAVVAFKPQIVYPYHYRNGDGSLADTNIFADLVRDSGVEVVLLNWY